MWLAQSFLVWTYAITTIASCVAAAVAVGRGHPIVSFLFTFVLHLGVLHKVTGPYSSRRSALSALRSRMLLCATVGYFVFSMTISMLSMLVFAGVAVPSWMKSSGLTAEGEPQTFPEFMIAQTEARTEQWKADGVSTLADVVQEIAAHAVSSLVPVVVSWLLCQGYLTMLITERGSQPVVESARVHDVVAFAVMGALGLAIGQASFVGLSIGALMLMGMLPKLDKADGKSMSPLVSVAIAARPIMDLAGPIMELAGQLIVATAVAERRVLGLPTTMGHVLLLFWAANFVGALPGVLLKPSSTAVPGILGNASWVRWVFVVVVQVAVVVVFGKTCWGRFRVAVGVEASKERRTRNARILSSRI